MISYGFGSSTAFNLERSPISGMSVKGIMPLYPSAKLALIPSSPGVTAIIIRSALTTLTVVICYSPWMVSQISLICWEFLLYAAMMSR